MSIHLYNPAKPDFILEPVPSDFVPEQPYIKYTCKCSCEDPEVYCLSVYHSDTNLEVQEEYHKDDIAGFESANAFGDLRSALPDNDIYGEFPCIPRPVRYHLDSCKPGMVVYELLPNKDETYQD